MRTRFLRCALRTTAVLAVAAAAALAGAQGSVDAEVRRRVLDRCKELASPALDMRIRAAHDLGGMKSDLATGPLLDALQVAGDPFLEEEIVRALGFIGLENEGVVPEIAARLPAYRNLRLRNQLLNVFSTVGHPAAVPVIQQELQRAYAKDPPDPATESYRGALIHILGELRDDSSVKHLETIAEKHKTQGAFAALGEMGLESSWRALVRLIDGSDPDQTYGAVHALGLRYASHKFKDPFYEIRVPALIRASRMSTPAIRDEAFHGLESIVRGRDNQLILPQSEEDRVRLRKEYEKWIPWYETDRRKNPLSRILTVQASYKPPVRKEAAPVDGGASVPGAPQPVFHPAPPTVSRVERAEASLDLLPDVETLEPATLEVLEKIGPLLAQTRVSEMVSAGSFLHTAALGERTLARNAAFARAVDQAARAGEGRLLRDTLAFFLRDKQAARLQAVLEPPPPVVLHGPALTLSCEKGVRRLKYWTPVTAELPAIAEVRWRMSLEKTPVFAVLGVLPDHALYLRFETRKDGAEIALGRTVRGKADPGEKEYPDVGDALKRWFVDAAVWPLGTVAEAALRFTPDGLALDLNTVRVLELPLGDPVKSFPEIADAWAASPRAFGFGIVAPGRFTVNDVSLSDPLGRLGASAAAKLASDLRGVAGPPDVLREEVRRRRAAVIDRIAQLRTLLAAGEAAAFRDPIEIAFKRIETLLQHPAPRTAPDLFLLPALAADRRDLVVRWVAFAQGKDWADPAALERVTTALKEVDAAPLRPPNDPASTSAPPGWRYRWSGGNVVAGKGLEDAPLLVLGEGDSARSDETAVGEGTCAFLAMGRGDGASLTVHIAGGAPPLEVAVDSGDGAWHEIVVTVGPGGGTAQVRVDRADVVPAGGPQVRTVPAQSFRPGGLEFIARKGTWRIANLKVPSKKSAPPAPPVSPPKDK